MSTPDLLVIAGDLDERRGGQERSIRECLTALHAAGADVVLAAPRSPGDDVPVGGFLRIEAVEGTRVARGRALLDAAAALSAAHRSERVVLSHLPVACHLYLPRGGLYPEAYARSAASHASRTRRFVSSHIAGGVRRELKRRERALLTSTDRPVLVALSEYVARQGRRWYGLEDASIRIVRNGVDIGRARSGARLDRNALGVPDDATLLLAAATNPRLKGVPQLIRAHRWLKRDDVLLLLVGGEAAPASHGVHRLGARDDIPDLLATVDAVVHPTFYDPSSRVVLEALAAGVPVVTTRWNGASEVVGDDGIVIDDPRDETALVGALEAITRFPRRALRDDVSMSRHAEGLLSLAREVA